MIAIVYRLVGPRTDLRVCLCLAVALTKRIYMMVTGNGGEGLIDKQDNAPFSTSTGAKKTGQHVVYVLGNAGRAPGIEMRLMGVLGRAESGDADSAGLLVLLGLRVARAIVTSCITSS